MSDTKALNTHNIQLLNDLYSEDPHFSNIVKVRLAFLNRIKDLFIEDINLEWQIHFSATHRSSNCVRIVLKDLQSKFAFYYQIPLLQRFELHLYLGNNTFNFFEAHPFLIKKNVMRADEYKVKATTQILPHLDLSSRKVNFQRAFMEESLPLENLMESQIYRKLNQAFGQFNEALFNIINSKWML